MSGLRIVAWTGATALAALLVVAPAPAVRAAAAQVDIFIEVNPSTIQAGYEVGIQASCGEDLNPATVRSDAFDEITLEPQEGPTRRLAGSATVPTSTDPGQYQVDLSCADGASASATLYVIDMPRPTRGPDTGGGGTAAAGSRDSGLPGAPVAIATGGIAALAAGLGLLLTGRRRTARRPPP